MTADSHSDRAHAKFGPSSSAGWMNCQDYEGSNTSSFAADRGTLCHEIAEKCASIKSPRAKTAKATHYLGETFTRDNGDLIIFDQEMAHMVQSAVDELRKFKKEFPNATWSYEVKLDPVDGLTDCWGTVDILGIEVGVCVIIADYKFGKGYVSEKDNTQFKEYGRMAGPLGLVDFERGGYVIGKVIQPQRNTKAKEYATYSAEEMVSHRDSVMGALTAKREGIQGVKPTDKGCQWCAKRDKCSARTEIKNEKMASKFTAVDSKALAPVASPMGITLPSPQDVDPDHVQHLMSFKKVFDTWYKDFIKYQQEKSVDGDVAPGTKVVEGRKGTRKWAVDEELVTSYLVNQMARQTKDIAPPQVLSPTKMEKVLTQSEYEHLVTGRFIKQDDGKPTLALADDKRKSYDISFMFKPVTVEES